MFKKPKKGRISKAKNNPKPTAEDICRYCKTGYASLHEVYYGTGRRQLSIKYGMQARLCMYCHTEVHKYPLQGKDLELKQEFQRKFEETGSREEFIRLFSRNYL